MKLRAAKEEALAVAWREFPWADDIRPQMVASEICVHVWKDGVGRLYHTEVFVSSRVTARVAERVGRRAAGSAVPRPAPVSSGVPVHPGPTGAPSAPLLPSQAPGVSLAPGAAQLQMQTTQEG